jgi:prepilin-type N-terminal cleavage/methylation domain-containing protein
MRLCSRRAFTLVELSIVLVIIALLIGGIASLRSYVANATLSTTINEGKYYIDAFNQFQTRYNSPPGDYPNAASAWAGTTGGDGNGLIRATAAAPGNRPEWFYTFQHLALAGFIQGTYTGATVGGVGTFHARIGTNVPAASADGVAFYFDNPDFTDGTPDGFLASDAAFYDGQYANILIIAGLPGNATSMPNQPFLTAKQAYQLDDKFDDGMPGSGSIMSLHTTALANCTTTTTPATPWLGGNATYNTANDARTCYLLIRMQ